MCSQAANTPQKADDAFALLDSIHPVSRETAERLWRYRQLLVRWQEKINLVAPDAIGDLWTRHVADSLQCLAVAPGALRWIDLGSGSGLPGLVIAIALAQQSGSAHHLVESNRKKCAFLRMAAVECGANVVIHPDRIETVAERMAGVRFDAVTARAVAPLPRLLALAAPLIREGTAGYFHKGRDYMREIEDSRGLWQFDLITHESRIAADSALLEIRNLSKRRR